MQEYRQQLLKEGSQKDCVAELLCRRILETVGVTKEADTKEEMWRDSSPVHTRVALLHELCEGEVWTRH